jgi:uroporphyrin-III C-methyltransferase/precorrin-2 dehydrogenase/sirohydrochlorin ferrochelatase
MSGCREKSRSGRTATHSLPIFVRLTGRPVILLGDGEAAAAKRRLLDRAEATVVGENDAATLAIVALDEPDAAVARLKARGVLVNAVDRPDLCDFTLPAIVDRDPVLIAIGTGGASAGLAKALRQRLEALLPATLGPLAAQLSAARGAIRARWPSADQRRRAIDAALVAGGTLDPFAAPAEGAFDAWLAGDRAGATGFHQILLRSADPDELSLRAARLLGQADRIYHRPDVPAAILDRARADAARIACAAAPAAGETGLVLDLDWDKR